MRKLFIRVDVNSTIATGHLMRCLAIAEASKRMNVECVFILADDEATSILENKGYKYIVLHSKWDDMNSEVELLRDIIIKEKVDKLLIDTYQVTQEYLRYVTSLTYTIYIDDLNAFIYPVNAIICYANYWKKFNYMENYSRAKMNGEIEFIPQLYLGCRYVPLRSEFKNLPKKDITEEVSNILIMSGGSDPYDAIWRILDEININKFKCVDVICGKFYHGLNKLKNKYRGYNNIQIHSNVSNLIDYMKKADLAISAGGTTLYELCAVGTPTISFSYVDNQLENVNQFQKEEIMRYIGDYREPQNIKLQEVMELYEEVEYRKEKSIVMQSLVDGNGAVRIVEQCIKNE